MNALLSLRQLCVSFPPDADVVRAIDLQILPKETLAIVGESGCGKSTVARSILRLLPANARCQGQILFQGQPLHALSEQQLQQVRGRKIGIVFQDPMSHLNPTQRVGYQVAEVLQRHQRLSRRAALQRVEELFAQLQLPQPRQMLWQYPHMLSGGQQQRVIIASALICQPALLIADEPTAALDTITQAQILALMKEMQHRMEMSILFNTHDLSLMAGFCDRIAVMYGGKIVEQAPVAQLFAAPRHPYTQALLAAMLRIDQAKGTLRSIPGIAPSGQQLPPGCPFAPRCPHAMRICTQQLPPFFDHSSGQKSACWRYDPRRSDVHSAQD